MQRISSDGRHNCDHGYRKQPECTIVIMVAANSLSVQLRPWTHMYTICIFVALSSICRMLLQHWPSRLLLGVYPNLLTMSELLKTMDQLAKEEVLLSKIRLCWHAQQGLCNPPNGRRFNFAHFLRYLSVPEEKYRNWCKVWPQGEVDMNVWEPYHPNKQSQQRFSWQFLREAKWRPEHISNWAWGTRSILDS